KTERPPILGSAGAKNEWRILDPYPTILSTETGSNTPASVGLHPSRPLVNRRYIFDEQKQRRCDRSVPLTGPTARPAASLVSRQGRDRVSGRCLVHHCRQVSRLRIRTQPYAASGRSCQRSLRAIHQGHRPGPGRASSKGGPNCCRDFEPGKTSCTTTANSGGGWSRAAEQWSAACSTKP